MPKYLPRLVTIGIPIRDAIFCYTSGGLLREKKSFDLATLHI